MEPYLLDWPIPSLVSLRTTWLGELGAALHFGNFPPPPAGVEPPPLKQGLTLGALADSYLYLGPRSSLTRSTLNPAIYRGDETLLNQLRRRLDVFPGGAPFTVEEIIVAAEQQAEGDPRFFPD